MPLLRACSFAVLALLLGACEGFKPIKGLPKNLPTISLHGSPRTPPHGMSHADYPFADNGDYNSAWAAEGGQGAGMDYSSWRSSHGSSRGRSSASQKKAGSRKNGSFGSYQIKSGDSLSTIASRHGTTVAKLKAANGLSSNLIRAGRTLKIPK